MKEVELVLTQASEAEFKKVKVSMEELKKIIVESIKAKTVESSEDLETYFILQSR